MKKAYTPPLETKIQKKISNKLKSYGYLVIRLRATNESGMPDLLAMKTTSDYLGPRTSAFFVEVKRSNEVPTPIQKVVHKRLRKQGFTVYVWNEFTVVGEYIDL